MIVNSQAAVTTDKTFNEFADGIIEFVNNLSSGCSRIDIVCDSYFDNFLKSHTREVRDCEQFFPFTEATNIPKDFQSNFLRHNRNKVALNSFMTGKLLTHDFGGAIVFISVSSEVKCNSTDLSEGVLHIGHTQEEADTKIIVHVKHCLLNGFRNIVIKTVDTDFVTLLLVHLSLLDSPYKIEVDFDFGKDRRFYKTNNICSRITPEQQLALLFFFNITGCDITSLFFDISKSTWWNGWCQNPYITATSTNLSWTPNKVEENDLNLIEKYVCAAYDPNNCFHMNDVNRLRFLLFTKSSENKLRKLHPTRKALQLHILCSAYSAGWIWV